MPTDYSEKERAFLDSLKANTGRGLDDWLAEIADQRLADRNAIIDWLRQHGLTSSNASWLERIYHNGGRPIYDRDEKQSGFDNPTQSETSGGAPRQDPAPADNGTPNTPSASRSVAARETLGVAYSVEITDACDAPALAATLNRAKGLRPLACHVLRAIADVAPQTVVVARHHDLVLAENDTIYGVMELNAAALKLGLARPGEAPVPPFIAAQSARTARAMPHGVTQVLVFDDVRQIDAEVLNHVTAAAKSARSLVSP